MQLKKLATNQYVHLAILVLLVFAVFGRTLGSYFLADDFGEVAYVSHIASGNLHMLWANFCGNYMEIPSMSVWRPWLLISLLVDFILWGAKPFGYYLTNLLSYAAACVALYYFIRNLTSDWCKTRSTLAAFFSTLIFALSPLHCESISWVVGRVDIVCALFYLLCLNFFIMSMRRPEQKQKQKQKQLTILSVVCFWLAMWTKEMAIGAPVLAFIVALLWAEPALDLKKSLRLSAPLLISTVVYFILRFMALGTVLGGYTQGIGDAQAAGALGHWLDGDTARRLFIPLAYSIYGSSHILQTALSITYTMLTALVLLRLGCLSLPLRWVIFWPFWLATALAPIYKLWGLGYELEGARFVFFATMALSAFFPVMLLAPHDSAAAAKTQRENFYRKAFAGLTIIALSGLAFMYGKIAARLNLEWVHAGKEVREFADKSRALAAQKGGGSTIVLGIPKRRGGAHMVLNGTTFRILLQPPFTDRALDEHILTFDPIIFGNADYINSQRFKDMLAKPGTQVQLWDGEERAFKTINLRAGGPLPQLIVPDSMPPCFLHTFDHALIDDVNGKPAVSHITAGDGIYFGNLDFSPLDADIAEVSFTCLEAPSDREIDLKCSWKDDDPHRLYSVSRSFLSNKMQAQKVNLRLSQNFHWYAQETIRSLFLELPPQTKIFVHGIKLLRAAEVCPLISLALPGQEQAVITPNGVYPVPAGSQINLKVSLPPALQKGQVLLEVSKPNAFFENFSDSAQAQITAETLTKSASSEVNFTLPALKSGSNYQLRARVLTGPDQPAGEASDPLIVHVN